MEKLYQDIFVALRANDGHKANIGMLQFCSLLQEVSTSQTIGAYINLFFTDGATVFDFMNLLAQCNNSSDVYKSLSKCTENVYMLLNNFPKQMADYIKDVIIACFAITPDVRFCKCKQNCAKILHLCVSSDDIQLDDGLYQYIFECIKSWMSVDKSSETLSIYVQIIAILAAKSMFQREHREIAGMLLNYLKQVPTFRTGAQNLLQGGYNAIHEFLNNTGFDDNKLRLLYEYLKRDCVFVEGVLVRRQGSRSAVAFITHNAGLFAAFLEVEVDVWTLLLQPWFMSSSRDDSRAGYDALISVYKTIGVEWSRKTMEPRGFIKLLEDSTSNLDTKCNSKWINAVGDDQAKLAICTVGFLAPTAAKFLEEKSFRDLFVLLLGKIEYLIFLKKDKNANLVTATSCDYVEALSPFLQYLTDDIQLHINQFKRVTIILIQMFPIIHDTKHERVVQTLMNMFSSIAHSKELIFTEFLEDVVRQGVCWTCSHKLAQEIEMWNLNEVTYKSYLPLWKGLLHVDNNQLSELQRALWQQLFRNIIYMSNKLNLKTSRDVKLLEDCAEQLLAEKSNDFVIFANLTDFYCDLLMDAKAELLKPWLDSFCDHMIRKLIELPMVSGFYKLLAVALKLAEDMSYFSAYRLETKENVRLNFENVKNALNHVLKLIHRYKDDLQLSCVLLILRMPLQVVLAVHFDYSSLFQMALKIGQHNFGLATITLETLTDWYRTLPEDVMQPLLRKVVPCLDAYLRNQFVIGDSYHVVGRKLKKFAQRRLDLEEEPELVRLQQKVLRFLAILPNDICLELSATSAELKLHRGGSNLLKVSLPIGERQLTLRLDPFLDRVLMLSVECTDRKVRITACELLHSMVAIFLGTSAQMSLSTDLDSHLEKILNAMLPLASDQDTTVVSLFNPLLHGMAHWYAHPKNTTTHPTIFIRILMDGVSNENNDAVRDLSGAVLCEFVAWTRKQSTKSALKNNLNNIKLIVEYIQQFSLHPDAAKRYGATVIFNHIYREMREEDAIIDKFWLDILYAFVMNLCQVEAYESDDDLLVQINLCLDRVTRCLLQKQELLTRVPRGDVRNTPPKFTGNTFVHAALFILQHTYHINVHCRAKCIDIFKQLPQETRTKTLESFNLSSYMHDLHTTPYFDDLRTIESVLKYFASLACYIEGHTFIMGIGTMEQEESMLWSILPNFINHDVKHLNLVELKEKLKIHNETLVRRIKNEFVYFKSTLIETIINLFEAIMKHNHPKNEIILTENTCNFLVDLIFDYNTLGLTHLPQKKLEEKTVKLLTSLKHTFSRYPEFYQSFQTAVGTVISKREDKEADIKLDSKVTWTQRQFLKGLINLRKAGIALPKLRNYSPLGQLNAILGFDEPPQPGEEFTLGKIHDTQREYFTLKLELMLDEFNPQYESDLNEFLQCLGAQRQVYSLEHRATITQGIYIFIMFKETILKHVIQKCMFESFKVITSDCTSRLTLDYFREFLKYIGKQPALKGSKKVQEELIECATLIWKNSANNITQINSLRLIHDLRQIVEELPVEVMLTSILDFLNEEQASSVQQVHYLEQVLHALGMVAPRGFSPRIEMALKKLKTDNIAHLTGDNTATLFIKALFEASRYSFCLDLFVCALDLYVVLVNDFDVDSDFCKDYIWKLPMDLQASLLNRILNMLPFYTFKDQIVLTLCLGNLLAYAYYQIFEDFFVEHIVRILGDVCDESLQKRTLAVILVNRLFGNIKTNFEEKTCAITRAACKEVKTGKELLLKVVGTLLKVCQQPLGMEDDSEEYRLYQCYAHNALITLVCNTLKGKSQHYERLFVRQYNNEDILWSKLVPPGKRFNFEVVFDSIPKKKKVLSDIRTEMAADVKPDEYLASQNLFLSTLADEVTNYDFGNVVVRREVKEEEVRETHAIMALEIEDEDINRHECMPQICSLIKHMHENDMLIGEAPKWVNDWGSMLLKTQTPNNVRQFLCKVIENSQHYLKSYATILIPGVIRSVSEVCDGLDSLAIDVIVTLLTSWNECKPTKEDTTLLIKYIINNAWNADRNDIFKYNISLLKTAVETYQNNFDLGDMTYINTLFAPSYVDKSNRRVIHVINILLVNNISPFPPTLKTFCKNLMKILNSPDHDIRKGTAEIIGLALKYLDDNGHESFSNFKNMAIKEVKTLLTKERFEDNAKKLSFVYILEAIVKNYPDFASSFLVVITSLMEMKGCLESTKVSYLKVLLKCIDEVCSTGLVKQLSFASWLSSDSLDMVVITLEMILQSVDFLEFADAMAITERVINLAITNPVCRLIRIDILIAMYKRFRLLDNAGRLLDQVKHHLIAGFVDTEADIRNRVYDFWTEDDLLPKQLEQRLLYLLESYDESNEELYLTFCNFLMLHDVRYDGGPIFEVPLHKCEFRDYKVNESWRTQNASMLPMFTASAQSQEFYLRATQSFREFDATQVLATQRQSYTQSTSLMTFGKLPEPKKPNPLFKNPNDYDIPSYSVRKWRFFKNKADVSKMHASREIAKGKHIDSQKLDAKKKKEVQVKIYRSYRTGDYPDVQIGIRAVTETLKELSKNDGQIAQLLYKSLFDSIVDIATGDDFLPQGTLAIERIFKTSTGYDPIWIGVLLSVALEHRKFMRFSPDLLKMVTVKSGNLAHGCLLIEEYLIHSIGEESSAKRGAAALPNQESLHWLRLADLYKHIEEWDVVHGIFSDRMSSSNEVLQAIKMESENYWLDAREHYMSLIRSNCDHHQKDFYYEAFFKCTEELGIWKDVEAFCITTTQSDDTTIFSELWSSDWNRETLLPYYLKARVRSNLFERREQFEESLEESLKNSIQKEYLRNELSDEIALFYLSVLNGKQASNYAEIYAKRFLARWKFTKPIFTSMQNKMLMNLKNCAEISVLMDLYNQTSDRTIANIPDELLNLWNKSCVNEDTISIPYLTTRMTMREYYIDMVKCKMADFGQAALTGLTRLSFDAEIQVIQQAVRQRNLPLAQFYTKRNMGRVGDGVPPVSWLSYSKMCHLKAQTLLDLDKRKTLYVEAFKGHGNCIGKMEDGVDFKLQIEAALHLKDLCKVVVQHAQEGMSFEPFRKLIGGGGDPADLIAHGLNNLNKTLVNLEHQNVELPQLADAFMSLANEYQNGSFVQEEHFIQCLLKGMKYGSDKARLSFPKLFDVEGLTSDYKEQFIEQTSIIPTFMFIAWIPQLLAYCDTEKVSAVKHIVINIAKEYPQSIIYAYKLSKAKFTYAFPETAEVAAILDELLRNELIEKMLSALKYVAEPSTVLRTALSKLRKASNESEKVFRNVGKQVACLFEEEHDPFLRGEHYRQVINHKKAIMAVVNHPFNKDAIRKAIDNFVIAEKRETSNDLGRYSPWLNYFHSSDYDQEIEVPGCYTGDGRPLPHYHPKISKFSSDVLRISSLWRPIRITIYANNVKVYRFLVKYGEDLRQDQRIQQLFKLMNVALSSDVKCRERNLKVSTFEVIPLTGDLGFIQWVDDTEMLMSIITNRCGYPKIKEKLNIAEGKHATWLRNAQKSKASISVVEKYNKAFLKYTKLEIIAEYQQLVNSLPWDAFRNALWGISPDPETFFALRMKFIRSYALMCVSNWLLGIGDRHLENILFDMETGAVIGIDFGHAFGSATQKQGVPELVPFRLTPQIVNAMTPLKESGLLQQSMVHALRVWRENSDTMLSTMKVFILEPTLNWSANSDATWNPAVILERAKGKFNGRNSISIMIEEVQARSNDLPEVNRIYVESLENLLQSLNLGDAELGVTDQVHCLIQHATEANLLGRMFEGWRAWI